MIILGVVLFTLWFIIKIIKKILSKNNHYHLETDIKKVPHYAIIIPARDESNVIEGLLESIVEQTYPVNRKNVYIIVEDISDKTIKIAKKYGMSVFVRKNLDLQTKGYAIDELLKYLDKQKLYYDLYFIFDADNILDKDFIKQMIFKYREGYAMATGYRALKNKDNAISISSWLTFLLVNEYRNKKSKKNFENILFSGTGLYIHGRLIKNWQGFPFHSLTEDYESSIYATLNEISTTYNNKACFYDDQPISYKVSIKQRSRWIKGYMSNWFKNMFKLLGNAFKNVRNKSSNFDFAMGILPGVFFFGSMICFLIVFLKSVILTILIIYLLLVFLTIIMLIKEKQLKLSKKLFIKTIFYHPVFLLSYIHAFLIFLFKKDLRWDKIEHK